MLVAHFVKDILASQMDIRAAAVMNQLKFKSKQFTATRVHYLCRLNRLMPVTAWAQTEHSGNTAQLPLAHYRPLNFVLVYHNWIFQWTTILQRISCGTPSPLAVYLGSK